MNYFYLILLIFLSTKLYGMSLPVLTGLLRYEMNKRGITFPRLEIQPSLNDFKRALCDLYRALVEKELGDVDAKCDVLLKEWGNDPDKRYLIKRAYRDFFSINPI